MAIRLASCEEVAGSWPDGFQCGFRPSRRASRATCVAAPTCPLWTCGPPRKGDPDREFESCSLRQSVGAQHSLLTCDRAENPSKPGPLREISVRRPTGGKPTISSLRPFFSKPPDCADQYGIRKLLISASFFVEPNFRIFEDHLGLRVQTGI
jgi:hypothetical protein